MSAARQISDQDRASFLRAFYDAAGSVEVGDWEAEFIESNLGRQWFTPAKREVIDRMIQRYGERIGVIF